VISLSTVLLLPTIVFLFRAAAIGQHHEESGRMKIIKLLMAAGSKLESRSVMGWTALIKAAFGGHVDLIMLLLANGAEIDAVAEDGVTPLIAASQVMLLPRPAILSLVQ
jgi:ankyrin repeat protein